MAETQVPKFDLKQLLGDRLLIKSDGNEQSQPVSSLEGKCPPCRGFTPQLAKTYNQLKGKKPFEVVFVSSDRSQEAFSEYYQTMPWAAIPFEDVNKRRELASTFKVAGIPSLIVIGPDGSLVNSNARGNVAGDPEGLQFPWPGATSLQQGGGLSSNAIITVLLLLYLVYRFFFAGEKS